MKLKALSLIIVAAGFHFAGATLTEVLTLSPEPQTYGKNTKIGFEFINEGPQSVWIAMLNGGSLAEQKGNNALEVGSPLKATKAQKRYDKFDRELPPIGTIKRFETDINKNTILMVWEQNPGLVKIKDVAHPEHISYKTPTRMYTFPQGKTVYVRWVFRPELPYRMKAGELKPEIGGTRTKAGVVSMTNLMLAQNSGETDIKELPIPR